MSNFSEQLEQIKSLLFSASNSEKSLAYSTLQHLQEQASSDKSLIQLLADSNKHFLTSIIAEIRIDDTDEEICTLALKCLGFIIYHPSLVPSIPKDYVFQVLESLARLIITTKIKVVCNLGVWCISIQQLDASYLVYQFDSLLRAIVHSIDNPVGSLSITFEAIQHVESLKEHHKSYYQLTAFAWVLRQQKYVRKTQVWIRKAVMKLATQISEKMKDSSNIWVPSICRRLLSADKRERDMCLRCLLKIKFLIVPPQLSLSKAIVKDTKLVLLPGMEELLKHGKKVQALQAWGWFIRILGHYSLKSRHLVNELLKIPEQTFSDPDPQIQIATQVAWEGLIDALIYHPEELCDNTPEANGGITQKGAFSKSLKLIMTPIIGIMTSKAGLSVHSSCLNTWCYLLHKLDSLVNDPHILGLVLEPVLKVIFNVKLEDENIWMWNFCMDLLIEFIQSKSVSHGSHTPVNGNVSPAPTDDVGHLLRESTLKNYFIKWLPWDCSQMDFIVRMIQMIFCQAASTAATLCPAVKRLVCDTALRMFCIFLKGVQIDLTKSSTNYDTVMYSLNYILVFVKTVCDTALCVDDATDDFKLVCLRCLEAVTKELDPCILGSPLYKVALDMKIISTGEFGCKILQGINPINYMDMVPPTTYLTVHHFNLVVQLSYREASIGSSLQEAYNYYSGVLSLFDSIEVIHTIVVLLYDRINHSSLRVWITLAQCLKEYIDGATDLRPLSAQPASTVSFTLCYFLIYPVVVCTSEKPASAQKQCNSLTAPTYFMENLSLEQVTEVWISLYCLLNSSNLQKHQNKNSFAEDLCSSMNGFLHQRSDTGEVDIENNPHCISQESYIFSLCSNIAECILNNLHIEKVTPEAIKCSYTEESSGIDNCLEFIARLMNLVIKNNEVREHVLSRLLPPLTCLVSRLQWKEDIVSLFKVLCAPLVPCLSDYEINSESIKNQLQILWKEIIRSLQRSWPTIEFNSSFLKLQASLLEKTLGHPNPSISDPTITFWNSTYGDKVHLDFPPCLLHVLDKLLRVGKLEIRNRRASPVEKGSSSLEGFTSLPKHRATATLNMCSKRVKLPENVVDGSPSKNKLHPCLKRKSSEFTEHQKEVRKAQQGKLRDCSSHGPGVRTYTTTDFSQGNQDDSQDSQDIRHPELILDLLQRTG